MWEVPFNKTAEKLCFSAVVRAGDGEAGFVEKALKDFFNSLLISEPSERGRKWI